MSRFRLGLIVNPIAGMGGRVGFKGTDGHVDEARGRGALPSSGAKAVRALCRLAAADPQVALIAGHLEMGQAAAGETGFLAQLIGPVPPGATSSEDTRQIARELLAANVDLILFAGGDGTACDVFAAVGADVPVLGIPAGVKMQSAVFATSPEAAGDVVAALAVMADRTRAIYRSSEIMDVDEDALRHGAISPRLYGYAKVPHIPLLLQNAKARHAALDDGTVDEAALRIAAELAPGSVYAIGPGRTAKKVVEALGLNPTLLGTDLILDRRMIACDANEQVILERAAGKHLKIVVGVIGGQGYVFGRGNHEISPQVIRRAGRDNIAIIAAQQKLLSLPDKRLLVDTGDIALDRELAGYWRVVVGPVDEMVMKVVAA